MNYFVTPVLYFCLHSFQGPIRMLSVVKFIENETQFDRGAGKDKGKRTTVSSVIVVLKVSETILKITILPNESPKSE